jgi:hypothetical protein
MKLLPGPLRRKNGKTDEKTTAPNGDGATTPLRRAPAPPDEQAKEREKEASRDRLKKSALEVPIATVAWLDERTGGGPFLRGFLYRKVPKGTNWYYTLGSATMFAFLSQAVTGIFLAMYYRPSATEAYTSVQHINDEVFLGLLVRGMHKWGATVMVILIFLHMGRTFIFGAYKYPRELNWIIGVVLLILTLVLGYRRGGEHHRHGADRGAVSRRLPTRRRGVRRHDPQSLLRDPHDADPWADRGADRRAPLPRGEARHNRAPVAQGREGARPRQGRDLGGTG